MMATNNSGVARRAAFLAAFGVCLAVGAADKAESKFAKQAEQKYLEARKQFRSTTNDVETTWQFGRACFDWAEFARDDDQREQLANEGIAACQQVVAKVPKLAAGHYYLAMNLGQLARTRTFGALKLVPEMEREFKAARELDEKYDYAGPDRNLGSLYLDAPGWPASIGNKAKARRHLQRAVEVAGHYPDNRLRLLEAHLRWGETVDFERERKSLAGLWEKARKEFSGETWEESWLNWEKRWKAIREKAGK